MMEGLSSSGEVGLMSANPRLAAQASCERIERMRDGQDPKLMNRSPGLTIPVPSICLVRSDLPDNENSMQVTRQRVRHSRAGHHRFIGVLGGCTEPRPKLHKQFGAPKYTRVHLLLGRSIGLQAQSLVRQIGRM